MTAAPITALDAERRRQGFVRIEAVPMTGKPGIEIGLEPWTHDGYGFDPTSGLGLGYCGTVVGRVINHRVSADCLYLFGETRGVARTLRVRGRMEGGT